MTTFRSKALKFLILVGLFAIIVSLFIRFLWPELRKIYLKPKFDKLEKLGSLVLYLKLDEKEGNKIKDYSKENNEVFVWDGGDWKHRSCVLDGCFYLDGENDFIEITDNFSLDLQKNITLSFWVKAEEENGRFIEKGEDYLTRNFLIHFNEGELSFNADSINGRQNVFLFFGNTTKSFKKKWRHVVFTYDGLIASLYLDGDLLKQKKIEDKLATNSYPLTIGKAWDHGPSYLKGTFDEIRIYNQVLTSKEIELIYKRLKP